MCMYMCRYMYISGGQSPHRLSDHRDVCFVTYLVYKLWFVVRLVIQLHNELDCLSDDSSCFILMHIRLALFLLFVSTCLHVLHRNRHRSWLHAPTVVAGTAQSPPPAGVVPDCTLLCVRQDKCRSKHSQCAHTNTERNQHQPTDLNIFRSVHQQRKYTRTELVCYTGARLNLEGDEGKIADLAPVGCTAH